MTVTVCRASARLGKLCYQPHFFVLSHLPPSTTSCLQQAVRLHIKSLADAVSPSHDRIYPSSFRTL